MGEGKLPTGLADTVASASEEPAVAADDAGWRPGLRLAERYVLRRFLGRGGMGQVWVAFDEVLDGEVALKRVRRDVVSAASALESLRREVQLAQTVSHAHVCRIYDLEAIDGHWVIKMAVVGGRSLAEVLRETPRLPVADACAIARQLADGLAAVHAAGVVHRDLKPHNVMIDDGGRAVLMDFGIAQRAAPTGDTPEERIVGTPEYMSPEQARGAAVDARADLYALGCVLYRMLAGQVPFPAPTRIAAMARHLTDAPPDPRRQRAEVPGWLARLVRELMAKSPAQRPRDAATVAARLAGPPPRWPRLVAAATALVLTAAVAVGAVWAWRQHRRASWTPSVRDVASALDAESRAFDVSPDGRTIAFDAIRDGDMRVYVAPIAGGTPRPVSPPGFGLPAFTDGGRALLVAGADGLGRVDLAGGRVERLAGHVIQFIDCGAFGVVYTAYLEQAPHYALTRRYADDSTETLLRSDEEIYPACDAASGRLVYRIGRREHFAVELTALTEPRGMGPPVKLFDTDGRTYLAGLTREGTLLLFRDDAARKASLWESSLDGKRRRQLTFGDAVGNAVLSADGRQLYFDNTQQLTAVWALDLGSERARQLSFGGGAISEAALAGDGRTLVMIEPHESGWTVVARPIDRDEERVLAHLHFPRLAGVDGDVAWVDSVLPDHHGHVLHGLALADGAVRLERRLADDANLVHVRGGALSVHRPDGVWRSALDGSGATRLAPATTYDIDEAPRGGWRVVYGNTRRCSVFAPGVPLDGAPAARFDCYGYVWSRDGHALYYQTLSGGVHRYDVASGRDQRVLGLGCAAIGESPDGRTLYYLQSSLRVQRHVMTNFGARPPL